MEQYLDQQYALLQQQQYMLNVGQLYLQSAMRNITHSSHDVCATDAQNPENSLQRILDAGLSGVEIELLASYNS